MGSFPRIEKYRYHRFLLVLLLVWKRQTRVDDMGNIIFKPIPAGNYIMVISLLGHEMIIEGLTIE